jgi:hypothetical protein
MLSVMRKLIYLFVAAILWSCGDDQTSHAQKPVSDQEVTALMQSAESVLSLLRERKSGKDDPELISYEIAVDKNTGVITLVNFKAEPFFPIGDEDEMGRLSGQSYSVDCTINGKTTTTSCDGKISCGKAVAACLDAGGCATICAAPRPYNATHKLDLNFLESKGLKPDELGVIKDLPAIDIERSAASGTLASVKIYSLI